MISAAPAVIAHVQMSDPAPLFSDVTYANSPVGTFDGASVMAPPSGMSYSEGADENLAAFTESFNASNWTSVLELVTDSMTLESYVSDRTCGITDPTYDQALPATYIKWTGTTHVGPCEVWCDDVRVFYDLNCGTNYPADAVPYDRSQCTDKSVLKLLFLAIHNPTWEVFLDCVGIEGGSSASSASSGSTVTASSDTTANEAAA